MSRKEETYEWFFFVIVILLFAAVMKCDRDRATRPVHWEEVSPDEKI